MDWPIALLLILGTLFIFMAAGIPIAFGFFLVNIIGILVFWGGVSGLEQLIFSLLDSVTELSLLPLALFVLMGEVLFHSGVAPLMIDAVDKWLGRLPGRLSLLAVAAGTLISTLTGASMGSVAMLGSTLVPEMEKRGYRKSMSLGPILGSGGLAIMIPPSGLAVFFAALGRISIGKVLMGIIIPGLLMAILYATYIMVRCWRQPHLAPAYKVPHTPMAVKLAAAVRYILPIGFVIFLVVGLIFLGVATPTEAAATGAMGTFILAASYRRLNWQAVKKSLLGALRIISMMFFIIASAQAFTQILAYSGAARGLTEFALSLPVAPIFVIVLMLAVVITMGTFMSVTPIMMITVPLSIPIVLAFEFDPVWFAIAYLLCTEMAGTTPPFGYSLFVMKGVAPPDTTMGDIYRAGLPFLFCDAVVLVLIIAFPTIALWLPTIMH